MIDIQQFAHQVSQMRLAQINYFQLIAKAKKTKLPGDFAAAATTLKKSKELEASVDKSISIIHSSLNQLP